jgi:chemotaxis protein MotA
MSFTTVLGVMIGSAMLVLAISFGVTGNEMLVIEEPWGIFVNLSGLLIVLGGVIAATFISFPAQMIGRVFHSLIVVFKRELPSPRRYIAEITRLAALARAGRFGIGARNPEYQKPLSKGRDSNACR